MMESKRIKMSHSLELRFAQDEDIDAIVCVINAAFLVERFFNDRERTNREAVRAMLSTGKFLLASDAAGLAGCVYLEPRGERGYFGYLAVEPTRQRSGLGRQLVLAGEDYFRSQGCRFSEMRIVNLRTELPAFYGRLGYCEVGAEPFAGEGEPRLACHFINYSKPL